MVDEEVNDIFKDFKFEDREEPSHNELKKKLQKEFDKQKYEEPGEEEHIKEIRELKEQVEDIKEQVKSKEKPETKHIKPEPEIRYVEKAGPGTLERGVLIGIILVLIAFIVVDLSFYHKGEVKTEDKAVGMVISEVNESENKTEEAGESIVEGIDEKEGETAEEETAEETAEEKTLSGTVDLKINKIYSRKVNDDLGYITMVTFTIKNGKDEVLKPVVKVFAFDKSLEDTWVDMPRGIFNYTTGIKPGDEQAGTVDLSPKTFRALKTIKTVILQLSDENGEIITSAMEKFYIE